MAQLKLPQDWLKIQLGDVVSYGKTQKCELSDVTNDTWVLELEDIEKESSRIINRKTATERPFKSTKNRFERGNVLYGKLRPYLNKVVVADTDGVCTTEIIPLDSEPFVLNRYLFHWLKTRDFLNYVNDVSYGVNMPRLGTKDGVAAPFMLTPLAEQKVIADKLDTLLAQVENTKARLERIPQILKRFRQSVLAAAVSGRLTEEWRSDRPLKKPSIIPNKRLPKMENNDYYGESIGLWEWCRLGSLADLINGDRGKNYPNKSEYVEHGIPFINTGHINPNGTLSSERMNFITEQKYNSLGGGKTQPSDLVYCLRGATMGKTARVEYEVGAIASSLVIVRPKKVLVRDFAYYFLISPQAKDLINLYDNGSAQPNLSAKSLASFPLQLPSLEEQTEIVRRVDQLFAHADRIEQQVNNALARVNNLTQSILAKAFRGELTEQWRKDNPELISGENSAEALLERIKAERADTSKPKRRTIKT